MPQRCASAVYLGLNTSSQAFSGMGVLPSARSRRVRLMPTVVKPQAHGTRWRFSGSALVRVAIRAGSRLARFGILLLSSGWKKPAAICCAANTLPGTTMS